MRTAQLTRKTNETNISLSLGLDGTGAYQVDTGCGFLNHMLELFSRHSGIDLTVSCQGDTHVDDHHTVEDVGIVLGTALAQALGDMVGITRYGQMLLPMDEVLVLCAVDLSGRAYLGCDVPFSTEKIGTFDTELVSEFFAAFVRSSRCTLHFKTLAPGNAHHTAEAMFKGLGRALRMAASMDQGRRDQLPSTKGVL